MIVTIDGPAGAGKSTVARALAQRLGFDYLDTGAMYRAVALAGLRRGVDWHEPQQLADLAKTVRIQLSAGRILLDGDDVTDAVRTPEVTAVTRYSADNTQIRAHLITLQRNLARGRNAVTEGRDQGTLAFPDADCKIYLTASSQERARRRVEDLAARGVQVALEQVLAEQERRDHEDASREYGALKPAPDAVGVTTDGLSIEQVVERLEGIVRTRLARMRASEDGAIGGANRYPGAKP
jgi:CMP/dCMP kinase